MARIVKLEGDTWGDEHGAIVSKGDELLEAFVSILCRVERIYGWEVFTFAVFVEPLDIIGLNVGAIGEHDLAEVSGGEGGVDVALEPFGAEVG